MSVGGRFENTGCHPHRKVEDLVAALGVASGISRSEASRICTELDRNLDASATGPSTMSSSLTRSPTPPT
jgi:hypothetical protein